MKMSSLVPVLVFSIVAGCSSTREPVPVGDVEPGNYEDVLEERSRLSGSTFVEIQEVRARADGMVFFCTGVQGLLSVDASDPNAMRTLDSVGSALGSGQYPRCQHLSFEGDTVYMSNRGDEIQPTPFVAAFTMDANGRFTEVGNLVRTGTTFEGVNAANGLLYAAMHDKGLGIFQLSGNTLVERGVVAGMTNAWAVTTVGTLVYVADGAGGLAIIDATNPDSPIEIGRLAIGGSAQSVEIDGDVAYVAAGSVGLVLVDIADPTAPSLLSVAETPGSALQVAITPGTAFVADWNDVRVFDVSDSALPKLVATERINTGEPFSRVLGIGARDNFAFVGEWTGLYALELFPSRTAPDLRVSELAFEFGQVAPGASDAVAVILSNEGTERLVVWAIETVDSQFSVDKSQLVLEPGETGVVEMIFSPTSTGQVSSNLNLWSDDPDEDVRVIPIVGNRTGLGVGDTAPEVVLNLLGGGQWSLSQQTGTIVVLAYFATF